MKPRKFTEEEIATVLRVAEGFFIKDNLTYLSDRDCYNLAEHFVAHGAKVDAQLANGDRQIVDGSVVLVPEEGEEAGDGVFTILDAKIKTKKEK